MGKSMRIAAGVILIIAAIINAAAGAGYLLIGVAPKFARHSIQDVGEEQDEAAKGAAVPAGRKFDTTTERIGSVGNTSIVLGFFLWLMFVLQVACAVLCFLGRAKWIVIGVGLLSIGSEVAGMLLVEFNCFNIIGIAGGLLAIIRATQIGKTASPPAPDGA
jgi:hypothetical protein